MIIYCCTDLIFASKVKSAAQGLGISARPARDAGMLRKRLDRVDDGLGCAAVTGVIIDLGLEAVAWELLGLVKAHDPALPVVVFGSHVEVERLAEARQKGADFVLTNGQFAATLPEVLRRLGGNG